MVLNLPALLFVC
jgi:hypothetical protein